MLQTENSSLQKEGKLEEERYNKTIAEKNKNRAEKSLLGKYDESIANQKQLENLTDNLQIEQERLRESTKQLQIIIQEAWNNKESQMTLQSYLSRKDELNEQDYYYLDKI